MSQISLFHSVLGCLDLTNGDLGHLLANVTSFGMESASPEAWGSRSGSMNYRDTRSLLSVYSTSLRVLTLQGRGSAQKNQKDLCFLPLDWGRL